jgi:hypothetical protein
MKTAGKKGFIFLLLVSLINLFRSMNINYNLIEFEKDEHIQTLTEFVHKTI